MPMGSIGSYHDLYMWASGTTSAQLIKQNAFSYGPSLNSSDCGGLDEEQCLVAGYFYYNAPVDSCCGMLCYVMLCYDVMYITHNNNTT
jgi:hypothetical protein